MHKILCNKILCNTRTLEQQKKTVGLVSGFPGFPYVRTPWNPQKLDGLQTVRVRCPSSRAGYPVWTSVRIRTDGSDICTDPKSGLCLADKVWGVRGGSWHQKKRTHLTLSARTKKERGTPLPTWTCPLKDILHASLTQSHQKNTLVK